MKKKLGALSFGNERSEIGSPRPKIVKTLSTKKPGNQGKVLVLKHLLTVRLGALGQFTNGNSRSIC